VQKQQQQHKTPIIIRSPLRIGTKTAITPTGTFAAMPPTQSALQPVVGSTNLGGIAPTSKQLDGSDAIISGGRATTSQRRHQRDPDDPFPLPMVPEFKHVGRQRASYHDKEHIEKIIAEAKEANTVLPPEVFDSLESFQECVDQLRSARPRYNALLNQLRQAKTEVDLWDANQEYFESLLQIFQHGYYGVGSPLKRRRVESEQPTALSAAARAGAAVFAIAEQVMREQKQERKSDEGQQQQAQEIRQRPNNLQTQLEELHLEPDASDEGMGEDHDGAASMQTTS